MRLQLARRPQKQPMADILPHPVQMERFGAKMEALQEVLTDPVIRAEACGVMEDLI